MARIGIFGGTFNPPHLGHKRLALDAFSAAKLDRLIVIPDNSPPHKDSGELVGASDRLEMAKLTFSEDIFFVSDIEIKRSGKSYTYDTLIEIGKQCPGDELFLIIGSDMLLSFDKWFRYEEILSMVTICCMSRESNEPPEMLEQFALRTLGLNEGDIIISRSEPFEISSTEIRRLIKSGKSAARFLDPGTHDFIIRKHLYT